MQECGGEAAGAGRGEEQAGGGRVAGAHLRMARAWPERVRPADLSRLQGAPLSNILTRVEKCLKSQV